MSKTEKPSCYKENWDKEKRCCVYRKTVPFLAKQGDKCAFKIRHKLCPNY